MAFALDGYVDVAERIRQFKAQYPTGSLQPADLSEPFKVLTLGDKTFLVYVAACYRSPEDARPGIGVAMEPYPGKTNYTRDSELMNAETSAWGRAIVAALAADTQKIASLQEVRNRQDETAEHPSARSREQMIADANRKSDEMRANNRTAPVATASIQPISGGAISEPQQKLLGKLMRERNYTLEQIGQFVGRDVTEVKDLTKQEASKAINGCMNGEI